MWVLRLQSSRIESCWVKAIRNNQNSEKSDSMTWLVSIRWVWGSRLDWTRYQFNYWLQANNGTLSVLSYSLFYDCVGIRGYKSSLVGWLIIWKQAIVAKLKYFPRIYGGGLKKISEKFFRIAVVLGEIQTRTQYSILNHLSPTLFNLSNWQLRQIRRLKPSATPACPLRVLVKVATL